MNTCPVANSLARYQAEYDRNQSYADEIARRAAEVIDSGDLDAMKDMMTALEVDRFNKAIAVICQCATAQSREIASLEVRGLINASALRLAKKQYQEESDAAAESIAVERFYARMERCGA